MKIESLLANRCCGEHKGPEWRIERVADIRLARLVIGMAIVFFYAVLGGMKGITYTQVAQYCVMIFAYMVPAIYISMLITGNPIPQLGFGSEVIGTGQSVLERLNGLGAELGFGAYTDGSKSTIDVFFITMALMVGTAGLPHVIVRFFTTPTVRDARKSAGYALLFIAILYTTAPAVAAFARTNLLTSVPNTAYQEVPAWLNTWENAGLIAWQDKNNDGIIQYGPGAPFVGAPKFTDERGANGERLLSNEPTDAATELYVDRDIMVLANPEIADLPGAWNDGMKKLLGLTPANDREGCLQDLHWFDGAWGYFPTYTLGAMTAAQLFDAAKTQVPEIEPGIAEGNFKPLFRWLKTHVHGKGSLLPAKELLIEATGKPLDPDIFKAHLNARYLA